MIYNNVKKICEEKKKSISQMERDLAFPRGSVYKWDESVPSVTKVQKVADYFGIPIEQLLADATEPSSTIGTEEDGG